MTQVSSQVSTRRIYQRQIPIIIVSAIATIVIITYFTVPAKRVTPYDVTMGNISDELGLWGSIIYNFVLLFGYLTLIVNHGRRVMDGKRSRRTYLSGLLLGAAGAFLVLGIVSPGGFTGVQYTDLYKYLVVYAGAGMYSAWVHHPYNCYRYFRFTSAYSTLFFATWLFVVFRELPVFVAIYPPLYDVGTWIETVVNAAAQRAALAAAGVGTLILGIRGIVGKEPGLIEMEI